MTALTLACGPYFDEGGAVGSLVIFLLIKPLAYFAFIQAFRYRVNRPIPMRFSQAVRLTATRVGLSLAFVSVWIGIIAMAGQGPGTSEGFLLIASWVFLYFERLISWWIVGSTGAGLVGRRLVGWVISGTLIGGAFDIAMVWGLANGVGIQAVFVTAIFAFILILHVVGRRDALRLRFANWRYCMNCRYDLTGNLSGRCPECGSVIAESTVPA